MILSIKFYLNTVGKLIIITCNNSSKTVIFHAQFYTINNYALVDHLGSGPPSWVSYGPGMLQVQQSAMMKTDAGTCASLSVSLVTTLNITF